MTVRDQLELQTVHILDGGMASELEFQGAAISGPLWSAHVLEQAPEKVVAVHRAYLAAGAEILLTASYQASRQGYEEFGLAADQADQALLRSVELATTARAEHRQPNPSEHRQAHTSSTPILIAASLGPYGAALHDGSEYHGNYHCSFEYLVQFHQERIAVLAESHADLLAFETLPSLEEVRAIGQALEPWPNLAAWFTFNCPGQQARHLRVAHGEHLSDCAKLAASFPQTIAIGINCTEPQFISSLIAVLRSASNKPIVVYPNSGEGWDAAHRCWTGQSDPVEFGNQAQSWFAAGAQIVGGCCRTRPEHIRQVAAIAR